MPPGVKTIVERVVHIPTTVTSRESQAFESEIVRALASGGRELLLDCSRLEQVYSEHIRLMWLAREICLERGVSLRLAAVRPDIIRILKLLDLADFFPFKTTDYEQGYADAITLEGDSVRAALTRFEVFLKYHTIPQTVAADIRTIFYEIAMNILNHGGLDSSEVAVITAVLSGPDGGRELTLKFTDSGIPFDPAAIQHEMHPDNAAARRQTRGYGLAMVRKLADQISYERFRGNFNVLTITKRWSV